MTRRAVILLVLVSLLLGAAATGVSATPPADGFYLEKACVGATYNGLPACTITDGEGPATMFVDGWIVYEDRVFWYPPEKRQIREIARVYLVTQDEETTLRGQIRWLDDHGKFTFSKGTGEAAGVHANGTIHVLNWDEGLFSLSGTYHVE